MNYHDIKRKLEAARMELQDKIEDPQLDVKERMELEKSLANYEYILELSEMNHYQRGGVES